MQQSNKKLVSLVLCFTYIICSFPYSIIFVKSSATTTLTCGQITEIVEKYISIVGSNRYWNANIQSTAILKEQVDAGDYLSSTTTHACSVSGNHIRNNGCTSNNFTGVSRGMAQCWGFGDYMEYVIFKTTDGSDWTKTYSVDSNYQFKPGDLIHTTKGSTSQHIVVVYKVVDSHVYIIEANWGGKCHINTRELVDAYTYVNASNSYVMTPPSYLRIDTPTLFGTESINLGTNIYAKIKNRATGKYITNVENGDSTNSLIGQNADEGLDQIWKFETVGENLYKISSMKDNWVLDVNNLDTENGTPLEVYPTYNGTGNQQFYIFQKYDGYYIMAKHSGKMIDMALDTLKMATGDSGNYQFAPQEFDIIKLNDHTWKWIEDSPATCTETGKKHQYCTVCGMIQNADTIIPTEKHTWGEGIIAIPATCLSDGIESYTCSVCGKTKETILAKTPHIDNNGDGRCDECGTVFEVSQHDSNCVCGQYHTGPFAKFIIFFHRIIDLFRNQFKFA